MRQRLLSGLNQKILHLAQTTLAVQPLKSEIWQQCITQLETELSEQQFNTWISPLQVEISHNQLRLLAPNRFVMDWVKRNYLEQIKLTIERLDDSKSIEVSISIGSNGRSTNTESKAKPAVKNAYTSGLNQTQTFTNYVEGKSNQLARAASIQVSNHPGAEYNPLYIYGGSGLGKTHLMQAAGNQIRQIHPDKNVVYVNCERFVSDMVKALQHSKINEFKNFYRNVDALLVDDIQFLADKNRSQEEFFHTFNSLYDANAQMIITCDRYPKEIDGLDDRIRSRLGWGLAVDIKSPDLETRVAILHTKAEQVNVLLAEEVAFFIANKFRSNIRDLEGALNRVIAHAKFMGEDITQEVARKALRDLLAVQERNVSIDNIQKTVAEYFKINVSDLLSSRRTRSITRPRQMSMALAKQLTRHSLPEIGSAFGGRDHTTVLHACRKVEELKQEDLRFSEDYENLFQTLSS
jgi:chromosomal replication initiator protein